MGQRRAILFVKLCQCTQLAKVEAVRAAGTEPSAPAGVKECLGSTNAESWGSLRCRTPGKGGAH